MSVSNNWKNVNNWHWVEKDYSSTSKNFISALNTSEHFSSFIASASFEGEFTANIRKGKIILIYDYKLSIDLKDDTIEKEKRTVSIEVDSADEDSYKYTISNSNYAKFLPLITQIVQSLTKHVEEKAKAELIGEFSQNSLHSSKVEMAVVNSFPTESAHSSFSCQWNFGCPFKIIRDCIVGSLFPAWSRSEKQGDEFILNGGLVIYKLSSESDGSLELLWKLRPWSKYSIVKISSRSELDTTLIRLSQDEVDSHFVANAKENWENYFWNPISISIGIPYENTENNA